VVNNKGEEAKSAVDHFSSISYNANHGFVRVSKNNPLYFEYSDGTPYFAVALGRSQGADGESYRRFAASGGNFNRLFLTNGGFNIEELLPRTPRADVGLGKMNLECSWNLDRTIELGEELGIHHILTLTNQWTFNSMWKSHTYNKANGGMLNSKNEYFTNEEAIKYFERRLRYIAARWSYSTAVASWDLWNEYSAMGADLDVAIAWHKRIAHYLDELDVFDHIMHTNDGSLNGRDEMHALPEIQMVSTNNYGVKNIAKVAEVWTKRMTHEFNKPYILTEFGPGHGIGNYGRMDPERRMVHDGLWSPVMSGSASTGMAWEGSWLGHERFCTYIHGVSSFVEDIPFSKRTWKPVEVSSFTFVSPKPVHYGDVVFEGWPGNFSMSKEKAVAQKFFQIDKEGNVENQEYLSAVLVSPDEKKTDWLTAPYGRTSSVNFKMTYPKAGEFAVYVSELRDDDPTPELTVWVDNKEALRQALLPLKVDDYKPRIYNQVYTVKVPAGAHTIGVANTGGGSILTAFELQGFIPRSGPDVEVRGLQTDDYVLLWLKNQKFTYLHETVGVEVKPQAAGVLGLSNVPDGTWVAEWMDTVAGKFFKTEVVKSAGGKLALKTPEIKESVAVRLKRIRN
jgi:hypothetical protein